LIVNYVIDVLIISVSPIDNGWVNRMNRKVNRARISNKITVNLISRDSLLKMLVLGTEDKYCDIFSLCFQGKINPFMIYKTIILLNYESLCQY